MSCGVHLSCGALLLQLLGIGLSNGAIIALNAIGVTLVYGAVRTINFAYGDLFALTTVLVTSVIGWLGLNAGIHPLLLIAGLGLSVAVAMAFGMLLNLAIEQTAFRPFRSRARQIPLIASIGLSFILFQVALIWRTIQVGFGAPDHHSDVDHVADVPHGSIPELVPKVNLVRVAGLKLDVTYTLKDLLVLLLAVGLALLVSWYLRSTRSGRSLRACAQDPELAELCGVNRDAAIRLTFALGGALAGIAAFIFAMYYNRPFGQHGAQSGLIAFAAAVLGGIGSPIGALLSGLLFGVLSSFSDFFLQTQWTPVLVLLILIVLLVLRPTGISGAERGDQLSEGALGAVASNRPTGGLRRRWLTGLMLILGFGYPLLDRIWHLNEQSVMTSILIFALLALGLNILLGLAGLLDLGYAAIFAIGGYTCALVTDRYGHLATVLPGPVDFLIVLVVCALVAGCFGIVNGLLTLRLRGDYLAIVTLAFGQLVPQVALNLDQLTGGVQGISALPAPRLFSYTLQTPIQRYYLALAVVLLIALASQRLIRSRLGRAWAALSADEAAALSCGVPLRTKLVAFILGAAVAGMAGALFASIFSYANTDQSDFTISATVLAMVIIGGAGSVRGAVIGAFLITGYDQILIPLLGDWVQRLSQSSGGNLFGSFDVRTLSYGSFGLALYLTVLLRGRRQPIRVEAGT